MPPKFFGTALSGFALAVDGRLVSAEADADLHDLGNAEGRLAITKLAESIRVMAEQGGYGDLTLLGQEKKTDLDWLWKAMNVSQCVVELGVKVASVASGIGAIVGGVEVVMKVGKWLGAWGDEKSLDDISRQISDVSLQIVQVLERLDALDDLTYSGFVAGLRVQLDLQAGRLATAMGQAERALRMRDTMSEDTKAAIRRGLSDADTASSEVLRSYMANGLDGGFWSRPFFAPAIDHGAWQHMVEDVPPHGLSVWDWRFACHPYLHAVAARLVVLKAVELVTGQHVLRQEAEDIMAFNNGLAKKLVSGLRTKGGLSERERTSYYGMGTRTGWIGTVDMHTGASHFVAFDSQFQGAARAARSRETGEPLDVKTYRGPTPHWVPVDVHPDDLAPDISEAMLRPNLWDTSEAESIFRLQASFSKSIVMKSIPLMALFFVNSELHHLASGARIRELFTEIYDSEGSKYLELVRDAREARRKALGILPMDEPVPVEREGGVLGGAGGLIATDGPVPIRRPGWL